MWLCPHSQSALSAGEGGDTGLIPRSIAESDFNDAVSLFGAGSKDAEGAKRHLRMIRRFNHVYGWSF